MKLYAGTSGFSYKEWKGPFYPEKLPAPDMLAYYSRRLPIVEVNNTFYRMPTAAQLAEWRSQVPETFRFAVKAPRRITHVKRLADCAEDVRYFLNALQALEPLLGSVLFQLPPFQRVDVPRLAAFAAELPEGLRAAFEFRHASWLAEERVAALLAERNFALVASETDDSGPVRVPWTARWAYLRLRKTDYTDAELVAWLERLADPRLDEAQVFFKHEDEAKGPLMAEAFLNRHCGESSS